MAARRPHALICLLSAQSYTVRIPPPLARPSIAYSRNSRLALSCSRNINHRRCIHMSTHNDDKSQSESGGQQHQGGQKPGQQNQGGQRGQPGQQDQGGQRGQPGQQDQGGQRGQPGQQGGSNRDKTGDMNKEGSKK